MDLKCPLTLDEQLDRLVEHGLTIDNREEAKAFLTQVSYYRLTGYLLQFRKSPSSSELELGHSFSELRRLYEFDANLRSVLRHYIEICEVYYKTHISRVFALEKCTESPHDQHYYPENYYNKVGFQKIKNSFNREKDYYADSLVVKHHKQNYAGKMPIWVMFELMSFSNVSKLYSAMYTSSQERIAQELGIGSKTLANHLHCMAVLRNKCAHTARLINVRYNPPAKLSSYFLRDNPSINNNSLFAYLLVLIYRLPSDDLGEELKDGIIKLIEEYSDVVDLSLIGFPANYKNIL